MEFRFIELHPRGKNESHAESMIESLFIFIYRHMTRAAGICFCKCLAKQESQSLSVLHSVCFGDSSVQNKPNVRCNLITV